MYSDSSVHGNTMRSAILGDLNSTDTATLYGWYNQTLKTSVDYLGKLDFTAGFCNDRTPESGSGSGMVETYYAAYYRLYRNNVPSLRCTSSLDIFKTAVGLITADELSMGGIGYGSNLANTNSYLYTNTHYWTMSPYQFHSNGYAHVLRVMASGCLTYESVSEAYGVRPVVNLKADTLFVEGGSGTSTNPYVVQGT